MMKGSVRQIMDNMASETINDRRMHGDIIEAGQAEIPSGLQHLPLLEPET